MPIRPENVLRYPPDWPEISLAIKERAGWRCECEGECGRDTHPGRCPNLHEGEAYGTGSIVFLTTAHLDHTPENVDPANLRARDHRLEIAGNLGRGAAVPQVVDAFQDENELGPLAIENRPDPIAAVGRELTGQPVIGHPDAGVGIARGEKARELARVVGVGRVPHRRSVQLSARMGAGRDAVTERHHTARRQERARRGRHEGSWTAIGSSSALRP